MPKYMLLLGGADLDKRSGTADMNAQMLERYFAWIKGLKDAGQYVSSHKLHDRTGARLSMRGGEVVEGPFIESKEAVGGIFVIEAASLEQAVAIGRKSPVLDLQNGYVEVRVVEETAPGRR